MFGKMRMITIFIVLLLSLLSIGAASAVGVTLNDSGVYVAVNGSDEVGDGSNDNPYLTMKKAIDNSQNGSNIYISGGNYSNISNLNLTINNKHLAISALNNNVIFNGKNNSFFLNISEDSNLTLTGIDFYNANTSNSYFISPISNYGTLNIINCSFIDNSGLRSGVLLNYGTLNINNTNFTNNQGNYTGAISNLGISNIYNSNFKNNRASDKNYIFNAESNGSAVYNIGDLNIYSSNFANNGIFSINSESNPSLTKINYSSFEDNSILYIKNSTGIVTGSYFEDLINVTEKGKLNITYSVILSYDFDNATVNADCNWWGHNERIPSFVDKWFILTFTSNNSNFIPGRTNSPLNVSFKLKDSQGIHNVPVNESLPKCFVRLIADNGNFTKSEGYLINNSFSSTYHNNTIDTVIYANVADYYLKLTVGTGLSNQKIYVSNNGSDSNDGSLNRPLKSLSKAIDLSLNGATIYILSGNYSGDPNSNLLIAKNLTFTSFNGLVTFLRGNDIIFKVAGHGQLNLNGITFTASDPDTFVPIINNTGTLSINNCIITNLRGGDAYYTTSMPLARYYYQNQSVIFTSGPLFINNTVFSNLTEFVIKSNNRISSKEYIPVNITITNSTFKNLSGIPRQSGLIIGPYPAYSLYLDADFIRIDNCTFLDNNVTPIKTHTRFQTVINNSLFINNQGVMDNGNADDDVEMDHGNNTIMNSRFIDNKSPLRNYWTGYTSPLIAGVQNFINCSFENNKIVIINTWYNRADNISIYGCYFVNNTHVLGSQSQGDDDSEGIIFNGGNLTVDYSVFENNSAYYGGAIVNDHGGNFYINRSVFINNIGNIGKDILNKNGYGYISNSWWGSNSGPTGDKVFSSIGEIFIENWVIMTLKTNGTSVTASLDKVTGQNGNIFNIDGILPSREVIFAGKSLNSTLKLNLTNNRASFDLLNQGDDLDINATIDNQTINLAVQNRDTLIEINNAMFYGKNNVYYFFLKNINGYLITNQSVNVIIKNKTGIVGSYNITTDDKSKGQIVINNSIGDYTVELLYNGDGYFNPSSANATMKIMPYYTDIFVAENQTFYGKNNVFYMTLYDNNGKPISGQTIKFILTGNGKNITYYSKTDDYGQGSFLLNLTKGSYTVKIIFEGDDWHIPCNHTTNFTVASIGSIVELEVDHIYGRGNPFTVKLTDNNGNVLKGESIILTISQGNKSESYNLTTNEYGIAGLIVNLSPGYYNVSAKFPGDNLNFGNTANGTLLIEKVAAKLSTGSVFILDNKNNILKIKLTDIHDRPLSGEFVNITISNLDYNKTYKVLTDNEGIASLAINIPKGNYVVVTNFSGNDWYGSTFTGNTLIVNNIDQSKATKISFKKDNTNFLITLTDASGKAIANRIITLNIVQEGLNSTLFNKTGSNGVAKFSTPLNLAYYSIFYSFSGDDSYLGSTGFTQLEIAPNSISTSLTLSNVSMKYGNKKNLTVKLTDKDGKILTGRTLTVTVKGTGFNKVYYFTTNSAGMISVPINLGIGKYTVKVSYTGDGIYKSSTASGTINVVKSDYTAPKVSKIDPANGATKVAAGKTIKVTFNEAIKAGSKVWVELKNSSGKYISFKYLISGKVLTIDPIKNLAESSYTLVIHTGAVRDLSGNPVALKSTKFNVGTAPKVSKVDPKNSATKVAHNKVIKVTFNEKIKKGSKFWVELVNSSKKAISFTSSISGKVLTIKPKSKLAESKYKLILHTGSVTDLAGNPLSLKTVTFSVGTAPKVSKVDPKNGATKVARSKTIKVTFNENIKAGGNYWVGLKTSKGKSVKITKSIKGKVLTIKHAKLAANTKYRLVIHTGAVTDKAGNPVALRTYTFATGKT